jgi:hypothetical protein
LNEIAPPRQLRRYTALRLSHGGLVTEQQEHYVHFDSCTASFNSAWRILHEIKNSPGNSLIGAAFQFAIIEYAKPYRTSYGSVVRTHRLPDTYVPPAYRDLHERLLDTRDKILAHADLTVMDATLHVANIPVGQRAFIAQNVIHGAMELSNIDSIIDLIEQTLSSMYAERDRLEKQLPLTVGAV